MSSVFSIAIDGPAGAGKSTLAKLLAEKTHALYLDTGAMYRAVGLYMLQNSISPQDAPAVVAALSKVKIDVAYIEGTQHIFLGGEDVSTAIRTQEASAAASAVSTIPEVRSKLVAMQQEIARGKNVIMDGRDIGTKVLPNATVKIFLVADPRERAKRRREDLLKLGQDIPVETILQDILARDKQDSTRAASPLVKAEDAVELDNTLLTPPDIVKKVLSLLREKGWSFDE